MINNKVSIIVPVYNVEKYIGQCIDSIIKQNYTNIEIILVDDGSQDNSGKICDDYAKKDNRIRVIHKKNGGVSSARNVGIQEANAKYITFVDSDDYIAENYIEELYYEIKNKNTDISICGTIDIDENGKYINKSIGYENKINSSEALKELLNEKYYKSVVWAKMYKKEVIENIKFNENTIIAEDLEFLFKTICEANSVGVNTKKNIYYYRLRENSASTNEYNENWQKEIEICKDIIDYAMINRQDIVLNAIRRYVRINCTCMEKILKYTKNDNKNYNNLKDNIKPYLKKYILNYEVDFKEKVKVLLLMHFKNIFKIKYRML